MAQGDESFEQLYREHAATVYRYALGTVGNPADAEDVTQATFASALRAVRRGERPAKPENWLMSIAHNECRQRFRRLGRRALEVPLDSDVATLGSDVADAAETGEAIDGVLDALAELPFNQRAALVLREVSGRSAAEIAECLGTSSAAVDMLVFRARQAIRTNLAGVRALALVPLPRSLLSFLGGSAASTGAGAVAAGAGAAAKLAAVAIAAVAVATSGGSTTPDPAAPAELGVLPDRRLSEVRERPPEPATSVSAPKSRAQASTRRDASAQPEGTTPSQLSTSSSFSPPPVLLPAVEVAPPAGVSLPLVLSGPVVEQPTVSLPAVPQLPPGLPEDLVDAPASVTEGIPSPGVTLPDAGTRILP